MPKAMWSFIIMCVCTVLSMDSFGAENKFDKYGGVLSMKGSATGAFHLEKINGRHCLVTPDGHGFLSLGVNHISAIAHKSDVDLFTEKYNRDWTRISDAARDNLRRWEYNTAGYGSPQPLRRTMPCMADSFLEKNSNYLPDSKFFYPDVFDPQVQQEAKNKLRYMCGQEKGNPNLIGYYWTDTPQWNLKRSRKKRGTDWVSAIRSLPAGAPGKKRYVEFLTDRHKDRLPEGYHLQAGSADELLNETFQNVDWDDPLVAADDKAFLRIIAREHYRVIGEETRRLHPGALIFGERYLKGDHPDEVLEEALSYIDVLAIQPGGDKFDSEFFDRLHEKTGMPILICDHQCSFATADYPKTMWKQLESEDAVGKAYAQYLRDAIEKPYIIGYHRCQYIDRFEKHPGVLKQGILRQDESPYEAMLKYIADANTEAIQLFLKE